MSNLIASEPGVRVMRATKGRTYQAHELPDSRHGHLVTWTGLGWNDLYVVALDLRDLSITVEEQVWDAVEQDYRDESIHDASNLNFTVYLP